jgi:hypothetical protein
MGVFAVVMTICVVKQKRVGHPDDVWMSYRKEKPDEILPNMVIV